MLSSCSVVAELEVENIGCFCFLLRGNFGGALPFKLLEGLNYSAQIGQDFFFFTAFRSLCVVVARNERG